jgi:radical SAM protein with 4Fe4S-binding SPASM domain
MSGNCAHKWLYIGPTGNVSQCGRDGDFEVMNYGKIQVQTLEEALNHPLREDIKNRTTFLKNTECKDCPFWRACHGGCPVDALLSNGNIYSKATHCDWVKPFLSEYFEPITGLRMEKIEG